jgi:hypothetical protein
MPSVSRRSVMAAKVLSRQTERKDARRFMAELLI